MVYFENFVASIKSGGKILREVKNEVIIPFESDYSILLKNLNSVKALVDITVDGRAVVEGLIVEPNSTSEIERFHEDCNKSGPKLRFIEKTDNIRKVRDDKIEDGLVQIKFRFEKTRNYNTITYTYQTNPDPFWYDTTP